MTIVGWCRSCRRVRRVRVEVWSHGHAVGVCADCQDEAARIRDELARQVNQDVRDMPWTDPA